MAHLIEHQSEDDGHRVADEQLEQTDLDCITQNTREIKRTEDIAEVVQADPDAAGKPVDWIKILKSHDDPIHRVKEKQAEIDDTRQEKQVQEALFLQPLEQPLPLQFCSSCSRLSSHHFRHH
jgi:hypothetical protein